MRVEVMPYYGLKNPLAQAEYCETDTHNFVASGCTSALYAARWVFVLMR